MADGTENNGWIEWRRHVLLELERINEHLEKVSKDNVEMCVDIAKLKVYAAIWGAIGGSAITAVVLLIASGV